MFGLLSVTGILCILIAEYLSHQLLWIAGIGILVLFLFYLVLYSKYEAWLAKKVNLYVLEYEKNHDIEKLKAGFAQWRPWAVTEYTKNAMTVNILAALLDESLFEEFTEEASRLRERAVTTHDWQLFHFYMAEYAKSTGDFAAADRENRICRELKEKLEKKNKMTKEPATARQSRRAFLRWLSFAIFLFAAGVVSAIISNMEINADYADTILSFGAGFASLSVLSAPVALVWLAVWLVRRAKEKKQGRSFS